MARHALFSPEERSSGRECKERLVIGRLLMASKNVQTVSGTKGARCGEVKRQVFLVKGAKVRSRKSEGGGQTPEVGGLRNHIGRFTRRMRVLAGPSAKAASFIAPRFLALPSFREAGEGT